jgi:hypothetical protein
MLGCRRLSVGHRAWGALNAVVLTTSRDSLAADAVLQHHGQRAAYQERRPAAHLTNTSIRAFVVGLIDRPRADISKGLRTICNPSGHRPRHLAGDAIRRERN